VHLAHLGHPILGDDKYGDFELNKRVRKLGAEAHVPARGLARARAPAHGEPLNLPRRFPAELERFRQKPSRRRGGGRRVSRQLVIFDWDGTLMDSTRLIASCLQCACHDLKLRVPEFVDAKVRDRPRARGHRALRGAEPERGGLAQAGRALPPPLLLARARSPALWRRLEMLEDLHARGVRMAVATGKARAASSAALDASGLRRFFEATRCADEGFAKPHPDMLHRLLDCTGVEPGDALMVGDTIHDLDLAANAGVDAVAVMYGAP
jgi:phosphoglycolate phosphatase